MGWLDLRSVFRRRFGAAVCAGLLAAACAPQAALALADRVSETLRPLEEPGWPAFLARVDVRPERAYVVLVLAQTDTPLDLKTPDDARRSLVANAFRLRAKNAKSVVGHVMVGWQCATGRGFASQTGESQNQGARMALAGGWGMTAFLSTYLDGRVDGARTLPAKYQEIVGKGDANVLVVETSEQDCQALRGFVARYLTHPNHPAQRYSMVLDPARFEGGGCVSFAMAAAAQAGVLADAQPAFRRRLTVSSSILGRRKKAPQGVVPYVMAYSAGEERVVDLTRMLNGSWSEGPVHARIAIVDPELIFAGVTRIRALAGIRRDWRNKRALPDTDPAVARAVTLSQRWAARFDTRRIADPAGVSALVLER